MAKKLRITGPQQETNQQSREIGRLLGFDIPNFIFIFCGWIFFIGGFLLFMLSDAQYFKFIGFAIVLIGISFFLKGGKNWEIPIFKIMGKHVQYTNILLATLIGLCLIASLVLFLIS